MPAGRRTSDQYAFSSGTVNTWSRKCWTSGTAPTKPFTRSARMTGISIFWGIMPPQTNGDWNHSGGSDSQSDQSRGRREPPPTVFGTPEDARGHLFVNAACSYGWPDAGAFVGSNLRHSREILDLSVT